VRLLVVEDDREIAHGLMSALRRSGHAVDVAHRCGDALAALGTQAYELVVLDLGLPDQDGLTVLRTVRAKNEALPVLILTARDALPARVRGLDLGADDYMLKPFEYAELEARIRAITRRAMAGRAGDVRVGRLTLKTAERGIFLDDILVELSPREFGVLEILMLRNGRVVSKAQIQSHVCDWQEDLTDSAVEIYVHRVRRKLETAGVEIRTVRGFGYLLQELAGA
jgi:two-component system OmpR family response regulator